MEQRKKERNAACEMEEGLRKGWWSCRKILGDIENTEDKGDEMR